MLISNVIQMLSSYINMIKDVDELSILYNSKIVNQSFIINDIRLYIIRMRLLLYYYLLTDADLDSQSMQSNDYK